MRGRSGSRFSNNQDRQSAGGAGELGACDQGGAQWSQGATKTQITAETLSPRPSADTQCTTPGQCTYPEQSPAHGCCEDGYETVLVSHFQLCNRYFGNAAHLLQLSRYRKSALSARGAGAPRRCGAATVTQRDPARVHVIATALPSPYGMPTSATNQTGVLPCPPLPLPTRTTPRS